MSVRVSKKVLNYLKKQRRSEESYNATLERLLKIKPQPKPKKAKAGTVVTQSTFRPLILKNLLTAENCQMEVSELFDLLEVQVKKQLRPLDYHKVSSGEARWRNKAKWTRKSMVEEGLLQPFKKGKNHGRWKLTPKGVLAAMS